MRENTIFHTMNLTGYAGTNVAASMLEATTRPTWPWLQIPNHSTILSKYNFLYDELNQLRRDLRLWWHLPWPPKFGDFGGSSSTWPRSNRIRPSIGENSSGNSCGLCPYFGTMSIITISGAQQKRSAGAFPLSSPTPLDTRRYFPSAISVNPDAHFLGTLESVITGPKKGMQICPP